MQRHRSDSHLVKLTSGAILLAMFAIFAALAAASNDTSAVALSQPKMKSIPWDKNKQGGLPRFVAAGDHVWISTLGWPFVPHDVWSVEPKTAGVKPVPIAYGVQDLYADRDGGLWMTGLEGGTSLHLSYVDVRHGYRVVPKRVPNACNLENIAPSVTYRREMWLNCTSGGVYVFDRVRRDPNRTIHAKGLRSLLPASNGLWLVRKNGSIRAVAGSAAGTRFSLPINFVSEGGLAVNGTTVWTFGISSRPAYRDMLLRIDLKKRRIQMFPLKDAPRFSEGIALTGDEVWLADTSRLQILRFKQKHPVSPVGRIQLPGRRSKATSVRITAGAGYVWVSAFADRTSVYRISSK